jgi:hypothetical protein
MQIIKFPSVYLSVFKISKFVGVECQYKILMLFVLKRPVYSEMLLRFTTNKLKVSKVVEIKAAERKKSF